MRYAATIVLLCILGILFGCAHTCTQSWDQENLKRNDHGCPTAIFIAPNGVLEQCP